MELSFSPDVDARICYAIVFVLGVVTAFRLVHSRVEKFKGAWAVPRTWVVWMAFVPVPVLLFWLLDRVSVLNDTSLFGAVLVGAAYDRILAGGVSSVKSPGELGGVWKALSNWADGVRDIVLARTTRNAARFDTWVIDGIMRDDAKLERITNLALARSSDTPALQASLAAFDANAENLPDSVQRERRARFLFEEVGMQHDFHYLMHSHQLISWWHYKLYTWDLGSWKIGVPVLLLVGVAVPWFGVPFVVKPSTDIAYLVWRAQKANATELDRHRTARRLSGYLAADASDTDRELARGKLNEALMQPNIPIGRVDAILALLLEERDAARYPILAGGLIPGLRSPSVDARSRIHRTLLFLGSESVTQPPENAALAKLADWSAKDHESAIEIESHIDAWEAFWAELEEGESSD